MGSFFVTKHIKGEEQVMLCKEGIVVSTFTERGRRLCNKEGA